MENTKEIVYVGDPLCSWCWGIAPGLKKLRDHYAGEVPFRVIMGGLRPFINSPMTPQFKEFLRHHWEEVGKKSGQPFNYDLLNGDAQFVYDTEPPCRAVVTVRALDPKSTFDFFKGVQHSFYALNKDTNQPTTYLPLLAKTPIKPEEFLTAFDSEEMKKATLEDFAWAKDMGIGGFPSVVARVEEEWKLLAVGYATFEKMVKRFEQFAGLTQGW